MKILIVGTPGVGKTTLSKKIALHFNIIHFDITEYIKINKLYENYNNEFDTYEFNEKTVINALKKTIGSMKSFIIDTHSVCIARKIKYDIIFHIKCDILTLRKRLKDRNYSENKIEENIKCELMDVIEEDLSECFKMNAIKINGSDIKNEECEIPMDKVIKYVENQFLI